MEAQAQETKNVTIRAAGKCHPAIQFKDGSFMVVCRCPGSQNGRLANAAVKIADGHDAVNCRK